MPYGVAVALNLAKAGLPPPLGSICEYPPLFTDREIFAALLADPSAALLSCADVLSSIAS